MKTNNLAVIPVLSDVRNSEIQYPPKDFPVPRQNATVMHSLKKRPP